MKKQADPWDDSALLNAFDDAITKYKKMHRRKERCDNSNQGEDDGIVVKLEAFSAVVQTPESTIISSNDGGNANDPSLVEENHPTDSQSQEPYKQASNAVHMQEVLDGYTNSHRVDAYNELLNQYYELEEQRQKVLQQLQETGYWNHHYSGEASGPSGQWGTFAVQEHQDFNQQASHPTVVSYCCPYACPCLVTPCSSTPACSIGGASVSKKDIESTSIACTKGPEKLPSPEDDTIVKTALGAAERAISSMNLNASSTYNIYKGSLEGQMAQNTNPESDLTVVLNAWYSAGFYTGKYLLEQSISNGKRG